MGSPQKRKSCQRILRDHSKSLGNIAGQTNLWDTSKTQQKLLNSRKQSQVEKTQVAVSLGTVPEAPTGQQWEESEFELKELSTAAGTRGNDPERCEPRERKTGGGY